MAQITFDNVSKTYEGSYAAVRDLDLDIVDGEFMVLVGPSGCGKSTALRMIAGLEEITDGELRINGRLANGLAPRDRDIAMVFQSYALYPHLTVAQNIAFGLKVRGAKREAIEKKVRETAKLLELGHAPALHAEGHVLARRHRRVERIGLEHHGDVAILWRD